MSYSGTNNKPGEAQEKLERFGLENVCMAIIGGSMLTHIASTVGVSIQQLLVWCNATQERILKVREARRLSAWHWQEKAEQVLLEAQDKHELTRARDLAHHYRWRAAKIANKEFGERIEVENVVPVAKAADDMSDDELATIAAKHQAREAIKKAAGPVKKAPKKARSAR